jgi:hypothetical protein
MPRRIAAGRAGRPRRLYHVFTKKISRLVLVVIKLIVADGRVQHIARLIAVFVLRLTNTPEHTDIIAILSGAAVQRFTRSSGQAKDGGISARTQTTTTDRRPDKQPWLGHIRHRYHVWYDAILLIL